MQQVQKIKLSKIEYSPTNPRKTFDDTKLRELAGSMAAIGLINPIKVRPRGNAFELVAGERRVRAAELSEWTEIDAIVEDMDDVQVLEAQLAENSQREDVHPIEEAEVYLALHRDHAYSTEKLAEKCGKSVSHVLSRIKIATSLIEKAKMACLDGFLIPSVADLIARLEPKLQEEALELAMGCAATTSYKDRLEFETKLDEVGVLPERVADVDDEHASPHEGAMQPLSYRAFQRIYRAKFATRLDSAPFNPADDELAPEVGPCTTCPSNSGNTRELFPDFAKAAGVCVNTACFAMKTERTFEIARTKAEARGLKVLDEKANEKLAKARERGGGDFVDPEANVPHDLLAPGAKPITWEKLLGKKHDVPSVLAKGERGEPVELLDKRKATELLREKGKLDEKPTKAASSSSSAPGKLSAEDAEKAEKARAKEEAKRAIRAAAFTRALGAIADKAGEVDGGHRKLTALVRIIAGRIVAQCDYEAQDLVVERRDLGTKRGAQDQLEDLAETAKIGGLFALAIELLAAESAHAVIDPTPWQKESRERFEQICETLGVDFDKQLELAEAAAKAEAKADSAKAEKGKAK